MNVVALLKDYFSQIRQTTETIGVENVGGSKIKLLEIAQKAQ